MTVRLIRLRLLQLYRSSGDLGLFRVLLVVVVILPLMTLFMAQRIAVYPWPYVLPAATLYIVWMVHNRRKDYHFLLAVMPHPRSVFIAEYFLFTIPVTALLLSAALYFHAMIFCAIITVIACSIPSQVTNSLRTIKLRMIPAGMFEWQGGIRKNLVVMVLFYLPGLFGFCQIWFSAMSLLILTMIFVSFYSEYEPRNMLISGGSRSLRFLMDKLARHTGYFALLLLPLLLIALVHAEFRWITAGYFLASLNLLAFSILLKYYQYRPGAFSGAHQLLTTLACFISVILPVAILLGVFNLFLAVGANRNLKPYFDDRH
jgi:hypothetical protein